MMEGRGGEVRMTQAEFLRLVSEEMDPHTSGLVQDYLEQVASAFTANEAFAVIALVDTPDVFE